MDFCFSIVVVARRYNAVNKVRSDFTIEGGLKGFLRFLGPSRFVTTLKQNGVVFCQLNLRSACVNEILINRLFVQSLIQWPRGHVDI